MTLYFGADVGQYNKLMDAATEVKKYGGNFLQVFAHIPTTKESEIKYLEKCSMFKKFLKDNNMKVVVHSSYTNNFASDWDNHTFYLQTFAQEVEYAHRMGAIGIVLHFGKKKELTTSEAFNNMYTSLIHVHNKTKEYKDVKIFLETPAGQGSEICYKMEDLAHFYKKISNSPNSEFKNRIKICLDTCHVFAAGYNLKTITDIKLFLEAFDELIGIEYIGLIHLNDSKEDVGSQVDRHASIGKGYIGFEGIKYIFTYFAKLCVPIILETPGYSYRTEIIELLKTIV